MPAFKDVSVEVHYRPIYLRNWFVDKKLARYISGIEEQQFGNMALLEGKEIGHLTDEFNAVLSIALYRGDVSICVSGARSAF